MDFLLVIDILESKQDAAEMLVSLYRYEQSLFLVGEARKKQICRIRADHLRIFQSIISKVDKKQSLTKLKEYIEGLPVLTIYSPFFLDRKSIRDIIMHVRNTIADGALVEFDTHTSITNIAFSWHGAYTEV